MEAQDIYHRMKAIAEDHNSLNDQLEAIAKWVASQFDYNPNKKDKDPARKVCQLCSDYGWVYNEDMTQRTTCHCHY